eukprot:7035105-Pyramimonas_sp.AAC.1
MYSPTLKGRVVHSIRPPKKFWITSLAANPNPMPIREYMLVISVPLMPMEMVASATVLRMMPSSNPRWIRSCRHISATSAPGQHQVSGRSSPCQRQVSDRSAPGQYQVSDR